MTEVWRSIPSHPNYEASSLGRIRSIDRQIRTSNGQLRNYLGRMISQVDSGNGYKKARVGGKSRWAHILIAEAFHGPRPNGMYVCHRDNDGTNNRPANLRHDTPAGNSADKLAHGTHLARDNHPGAKLTNEDVAEIRSLLNVENTHREIAERFSVSRQTVSLINQGRTWL